MKILGIIPARGGSKGVPKKNIKLLGGKPLLQYTTEVALASKYIDTLVVSTDCNEIATVAKNLGAEVPFLRPVNLATDKAPTLPVILHALAYYQKQGIYFDAVCLLQATSPFRTVTFLDKAIEKFIKSGADALVSVQEVPHEYNPHWTFTVNANNGLSIATGDKAIVTRRQDLPKAYHRDGSIYLTKRQVLQEQQSLYGKNIAYLASPKEWYVNIDTMDDWAKAEQLVENLEL